MKRQFTSMIMALVLAVLSMCSPVLAEQAKEAEQTEAAAGTEKAAEQTEAAAGTEKAAEADTTAAAVEAATAAEAAAVLPTVETKEAAAETMTAAETAETAKTAEVAKTAEAAETAKTAGAAETAEASQRQILAVYACPARQILTDEEGKKGLADTVIYLFTDQTFRQYVIHEDRFKVYSEGVFTVNFDWDTVEWGNADSHILTLHVNKLCREGERLEDVDLTYDVDLDRVRDYCVYPADFSRETELAAAFMATNKQRLVRLDGSEEYLSTMWFYYSDGTFCQYAFNGEEDMLFSSGDYTISGGGFDVPGAVLRLHRTKKYQDGKGLADYDSTHDYTMGELDFMRIYPINDEEEKEEEEKTGASGETWDLSGATGITDQVKAVFEKAAETLMGVDYEPVCLLGTSTAQDKEGRVYCVLSRARVVYPDAEPYYALVYIHEDKDGAVTVQNIYELWVDAHSRR